jgi:transaldolase/glucose-6-phosphate isomerase
MANPLKELNEFGQSVWLDFVSRDLLKSGDLKRLVAEDGLRGVTSNPSIFEKAIGHGDDYDEMIRTAEANGDLDPAALFEDLAVREIQEGADQLAGVYEQTQRRDGYISLEVSPYLAMDTHGTIEEARRLWREVDRRNLMVKVPGTKPGIPAIRTLIGEGININVTLLFAREVYAQVADAYVSGLEDFVAKGGDPHRVASVASFFISRIDTLIDDALDAKIAGADPATTAKLSAIKGKVAIANAKLTYQLYNEIYSSERWLRLAQSGAQTQRLLWASTGTKNKAYSDVLYCDELIGSDTVNTMPPATMDAFRDHGRPRASLEEDIASAQQVMATLSSSGVSLEDATHKLVADGVRLFADAADQLYAAVQKKRRIVLGPKLNAMSYKLPQAIETDVKVAVEDWRKEGKIRRLWHADASLWTEADEAKWVGWLDIVNDQLKGVAALKNFAADVKQSGFSDVLLLGMGGSSLGPEVFAETFGSAAGFPKLHVLDSTDPAQVKAFENKVDLKKTLFLVSSKSGSTLEPNIFKAYFFDRATQALGGAAEAAKHFVAITDPGSAVERMARSEGFRAVFHGLPSIGGRYSVLSNFGMVPAVAIGTDPQAFLDSTAEMVRSCAPSAPPAENPGVILGAIMGVCQRQGRDKVTVLSSPGVADFGAWLEQLLAESTGKIGKGIVPVDAEVAGAPSVYGNDRLFAYARLASDKDETQEAAVAALEAAGQPVVRILINDKTQLGQEFFRWEMATAVAGSIIGINPFDQPDVEASKIKTRELTAAYDQTGKLPPEAPFAAFDGVELFADPRNEGDLRPKAASLAAALKAHLDRAKAGDYVALLAYIERTPAHIAAMQKLRLAIRDQKKLATCLGFGPRFLHSTGQAYKGGPNSGVFLQITCSDPADLQVPGAKYTFGVVKAAQARGDFDVLAERGRRALRVHLASGVEQGLETLASALEQALK